MKKKKIMFVCLGNICRSPLAHGIFQKIVNDNGIPNEYQIESSGTCAYHIGEQADERIRKTAKNRGVLIDHKSRQIFKFDLEEYDYIFAMDRSNLDNIKELTTNRKLLDSVFLFRDFDPQGRGDVPDPYYGGQAGFDNIFDMVLRTCENIFKSLEKGRL